MTDGGLDEQELVRALRAPGSPAELADEEAYRAMFREHGPGRDPVVTLPRPRRAAVRRIGTTTTLAAVVAVATAGVAAAYSSQLPDPLQSAVHRVLAPIGVPPVAPRRAPEHPTGRTAVTAPATSPTPSATAEPSTPTPSARRTPSAPGPVRSATPSATPSPTLASTPSTSPSPTIPPSSSPSTGPAPRPVPAAVSISAATGHRVAPGQTTVFQGTVSAADGTPVPGVRVVLRQRSGSGGWVRVAAGRTGADGAVSLTSPPAERTAQLRLAVGKVHSTPWRLVVQPALSASSQTQGDTAQVSAQASGGQPGDRVQLLVRRGGRLVVVASGTLDGSGGVTLQVPAPHQQKSYVVHLLATAEHGDARTRVSVAPAVSSSR